MQAHLNAFSTCIAAAFALTAPLAGAADRTVVNCANQGNGSLRSANSKTTKTISQTLKMPSPRITKRCKKRFSSLIGRRLS